MPLDPAKVEFVKAWFHKAAGDIVAGSKLAVDPEPDASQAAFFAQQAAEKAMKRFLVWHDVAFRKTHDLGEVGQLCSQVDPSLRTICKAAESIGDYATVFRYPPSRDATPLEAVAALKIAKDVYNAVLARLPLEVRPEKSP